MMYAVAEGPIMEREILNSATEASYPVMEHFYTLQGEGRYSGQAAYFIRLGGCDVGCVWCDVKDSWDAAAHPLMSVQDIVATAAAHPGRIAVITGGEPAMHELGPLTDALHVAGFRTHIETSGAHELNGALDFVTLSPKKFKAPLESALRRADELKVVVYHKSDLLWAEQHAASVSADCALYLQPEWSRHDTITPLIIDYIKQHPQWQLSLQTHKYINIP
jgi:7-carboxy-7-deazaguanine synthase